MKEKKSTRYMKTLGSSNHVEEDRGDYDYYATDPFAIDLLLTKEKPDKNIWECACGEGHLSKRLKEFGYNVKSTDLINRNYGESDVDFLHQTEKFGGDILTNPPYAIATEFIERALHLTDGKFLCL